MQYPAEWSADGAPGWSADGYPDWSADGYCSIAFTSDDNWLIALTDHQYVVAYVPQAASLSLGTRSFTVSYVPDVVLDVPAKGPGIIWQHTP